MKTYKIKVEVAARRAMKKMDPHLFREINTKHIIKIAQKPRSAGQRLSSVLNDFWSYHFHFSGTQYRIIYQIFEQEIVVAVIDIGKREDIYRRMQRKI